ncbi:MAG: hypothetical protein ACYC91_02675 [Solirubrobacteraceae bacterium]
MLFLHGGEAHTRNVYRDQGRGDWARALPLVLEKHGYMAFESLSCTHFDPRELSRFDCALIARLPAAAWSDALLKAFFDSGVPCLFEMPASQSLRDRLGILGAESSEADSLQIVRMSTDIRRQAAALGREIGGRLGPPKIRYVERDPSMDWASIPSVPITSAHAERWSARGWDCERWSVSDDTDVLAAWAPVGGTDGGPAIIRRGHLMACSFAWFAALGQAHTAPPWGPREFRSSGRSLPLEELLLTVIDLLHRSAGAPRARILPWPSGSDWVLNVRHDFDRPLSPRRVQNVLAGHARAGTAATWYWRSRHLAAGRVSGYLARRANRAVRLVAGAAQQEVALHTEKLWTSSGRELELLSEVAGGRPLGSTSHGDPTCFRFQGAPNILWAERHRLLYTELIQHGHMLPHRFASLEDDGTIRFLNVICLPHHESLDRTARDGDTNAERLRDAPGRFSAVNGMLQVMNHPDVNQRELFELLESYPRERRLDWTAGQAADWWRGSHTDRISVSTSTPGSFTIESAGAVRDLEIELMDAQGHARRISLSLAPGQRARIG